MLITLIKKLNPKKGFTVVELLVAMSLFVILITIVSGSFIRVLRTQRITLALIAANSNAQLAIEQMAREMRTGRNFCGTECVGYSECSENRICFTGVTERNVVYRLAEEAPAVAVKSIERSADNGVTFKKITADNVRVNNLKFKLFNGSLDNLYPWRITIILQVGAPNVFQEESLIDLQTTVSSRVVL